jgi:hypothetical protein
MVFDFDIAKGSGSSVRPQGPVGDEVVSLETSLGEVGGNNDSLGFAAFSKLRDFYFTGLNNLFTRRYAARNVLSSGLNAVGTFEYAGYNPGVILIYSDGSASIWRNNFAVQQTIPANSIQFYGIPLSTCSFTPYGSSIFLATGGGFYEFDFSSGGTVNFKDVTAWMAEYAVKINTGVNLGLIAIGDVFLCVPPVGTPAGFGNSILYIRGIRKPPDAFGNAEYWVSGSELLRVKLNSSVSVVGKTTVTGKLVPTGADLTFASAASLRPAANQLYGLPVVCAEYFNTLMIATTKNYLGGSFPGVPENWNLALADGAFFTPILARTSLRPTQLLSHQEGLFVGMSNPEDTADGQLFLYSDQAPSFVEVTKDVGPLPNTMVALVETVYFLSGKGIHPIEITNVRKQAETKTCSGALGRYFSKNKPKSTASTWSIFDKLTGQIWYGFETKEGRRFLNMDPLITEGRKGESNRFSFFENLPVELACSSKETPLLWLKDIDSPVVMGNVVQLNLTGAQDFHRSGRLKKISGKIVTGPAQFNTNGSESLMKDVYLAADNFQGGAITISVLVDTINETRKLGTIQIKGKTILQDVFVPGVFADGLFQGSEQKLFEADPYQEHRGHRFRLMIEETGFNVQWELVALSLRGLSSGYRRTK